MVTIALSPRVAKAVSGSRFIHSCQPPPDWSRLLCPKAWNIVVESNRKAAGKGKGRDAPEFFLAQIPHNVACCCTKTATFNAEMEIR